MKPGEVRRRGGGEAVEFLVVKMAGDAEAVVALFRREAGEEQGRADQGSGETAPPQREASKERAADRRRLPRIPGVYRTVTVTGLANITRAEGPPGPPRGST